MAAVAEFRMCDIRVEVAAAGCNGGSRMEFLPGWNVAAVGWNVKVVEWNVKVAEWNVAAAEWNSFPGGMCRIPYSLYFGFAYGFQRLLLNLGLLW